MAPQVLSPDDAVALVRPVDTIGFGLGPANPPGFLTALGRRDDWVDLQLGGALLLGLYEVLMHPGVSYRCGFFGPVERGFADAGYRIAHVPGGFRQFAPILRQFNPRIMCVQATPPDTSGNCNLSLHYGATRDELLRAAMDPNRLLVVEINAALPRTHTIEPAFSNTIAYEMIDVVIEGTEAPFVLEQSPSGEIEDQIARHAISYVRDGSTLQTGIGSIPSKVAAQLAAGTGGDYGIHSEMFTDGLMALHLAGKVTNAHKDVFAGRSVTTFALGTAGLYEWLDDNLTVAFLPVEVINDPSIIGRNRNLISINGAISVDLYGQIVADAIGGRQISGVGGHEDFVAGAELALDDHSLVCLASTATVGGELVSRIVPVLPEGSIVSTPRHHTAVIVTEFGSADLRGLTVHERALALAQIAHPTFRPMLEAAASTFGTGWKQVEKS